MSLSLPTHPLFVTGSEATPTWVKNTRSNDAIIIRHATNSKVYVASNQRLTGVIAIDCHDTEIVILDSAVISSRSVRLVDCTGISLFCEDVDVRRVELFRCRGCTVTVVGDDVLRQVLFVLTREGCAGNTFALGEYVFGTIDPPAISRGPSAAIPDSAGGLQYFTTVPHADHIESRVLADGGLTPAGLRLQAALAPFTLPTVFRDAELFAPDLIPTGDSLLAAVAALESAPYAVTDAEIAAQYDAERAELFEEADALRPRVREVADLMRRAQYCMVYTGAGISTSAKIPDYRGPTGVWTLIDKGESPSPRFSVRNHTPTYAHYAITELARRRLVRFVMTTNVDGFHWRSGLPPHLQEELHGSAFKLFCENCGGFEYRPYDCIAYTENHVTGETCAWCGGKLLDTLVMFSEGYRSPLEEVTLRFHAEKADLAIVLGTSLCVQSAAMYPTLVVGKGNLVIVNAQHTPLDSLASVRLFAKTDLFCQLLMEELGITEFDREGDAIEKLAQERGEQPAD
jgi:NAD-dependent SIR2 family protein deacetylase